MCKTWMDRWQELEGAIIARLAIEDAKDLSDSELLRCFRHCATECLMSVTVPARDKGMLLFESIIKMREEMTDVVLSLSEFSLYKIQTTKEEVKSEIYKGISLDDI